MKVYLAGPMRGHTRYNFQAFEEAADLLREDGHEVVSPAEMDRKAGINPYDLPADHNWHKLPPGTSIGEFYDRDTQAIKACDAIVLLAGWAESTGATAELYCAEWLGKKVYELYQLIGKSCECDESAGEVEVSVQASPDILEEALEITRGDRQNAYGPPGQDFARTAGMWSALFGDLLKDGVAFEPFHVAQAMILLKMSRQLHQRSRDNWTDTAGYARCGNICDEESVKKGGA